MASLPSLAYGLGVTAVVVFGVAACAYAIIRQMRQGKADSAEFFLTARNSVGMFTIAWSFYAGAMGSWALFGPPSYCLTAGVLGVIMYAVAAGIPIIIVACFGAIIHRLVPDVLSMSDFVHRRFGLLVSLYVVLIMLFNMGIALTAEYTAVGDLFEFVIGTNRVAIVVVIGCVAMLYTAIGGLYVSIITDQWQALTSVVFIVILVIYVAVTFDTPLGPLPESMSWNNYYGLSSIAVMPISLTTSTLFSEAMWQRCWASANRKSLIWGSVMGAVCVTTAVFILGFGGVLAVWGGKWTDEDPYNIVLFTLFNNQTWILVIVTLLAVVMSESAVDSLQNAIVDTISSTLFTLSKYMVELFPGTSQAVSTMQEFGIWWIRGLVIILNIPPIIISLKGYNVLQLFLMANLITSASFIPIMLGVVQGPTPDSPITIISRIIVTPFSAMLGCMCGFTSLFWWTALQQQEGQTYDEALYTTFFLAYDYPPFLIAPAMSIAGLLLGAGLEYVTRKAVPRLRNYPQYDLSVGLEGDEDKEGMYQAGLGKEGYEGQNY